MQNCRICSIRIYFPKSIRRSNEFFAALNRNEAILIYGDNDVDGITAAALLTEFLKSVGGKVFYYVPNRNTLKKYLIGDALEVSLKNRLQTSHHRRLRHYGRKRNSRGGQPWHRCDRHRSPRTDLQDSPLHRHSQSQTAQQHLSQSRYHRRRRRLQTGARPDEPLDRAGR